MTINLPRMKGLFTSRFLIVSWAVATAHLLSALSFQPAFSQEIKKFHSDIRIAATGNLDVCENIRISFDKAARRHQFYRIIPTVYDRGSKSRHAVDVCLKNVSMDGGKPVAWSSWVAGREVNIRIGDENEHFEGIHSFEIVYEVHKGVDFVHGAPELFMNVTGDRWPFPIDSAEVVVSLPKGTDLTRVSRSLKGTGAVPYMGASIGPTPKGDSLVGRVAGIAPGHGVLLQLGMPPGTVVSPSVLQEFVWHLQHSYQVFVLPVATIVLLSAWWFFYGRDPQTSKASGWRPPEGLTPAEVGTLIDERCDLTDVVSTVVDLAVRGYIKIRVLPFNGFLYLSNRDYEFTLLQSPKDRELKPHEQLFLSLLFGMSNTTYVSALKGQFADYLPYLKRQIYTSLVQGGYFARDPDLDRKNFLSVGAAVITVGVALMIASTYHIGGTATALGSILSGLVLLCAANAMPKRTTEGVRALEQIKSFRNFMVFGEKNDLETVAREETSEFNRFLPHAIVLGVADHWARVVKDSMQAFPEWFELDRTLVPQEFSAIDFVTDLGEALHIINRSLTDVDHIATTNADEQWRSLVGGIGYPP